MLFNIGNVSVYVSLYFCGHSNSDTGKFLRLLTFDQNITQLEISFSQQD